MSDGFIRIKDQDMVVNGKPILLKGAGLGGWMNMENFITGYPGHEFQVRAELLKVLGQKKYEYFFDKFLEYFFTEDDAKFFASLGLNCIRLPVNYRHFEDDMNPRVFKKEGYKHLDRVIDLCAKHGIYTVIDLHAAPGGQNIDWHSDSGSHQALFWEHKDFQDRTILIWEELARHYKDNTWIAGYNPLNEPTDSQHVRLLAFYERVEKSIRAIDPNHLLFLDGNTFGADFSQFKEPLKDCVYAFHDYSKFGFPNPPAPFIGSAEQVDWHRKQFERKAGYMIANEMPMWNGEFGPVYANPTDGPDWQAINEQRYGVLKTQLELYAEKGSSWSIWLYKDIGFQGMVYVGEDTAYMKLLKPFLEKKKALASDRWGCDDVPVRAVFEPMEKWLQDALPSLGERYPKTWKVQDHLSRVVRNILLSEELCVEYASYFKGLTLEELDELARSFSFGECKQRERLNETLTAESKRS